MKKWQELLYFLFAQILLFVFRFMSIYIMPSMVLSPPSFMDMIKYLELLLQDSVALKAIFNTYFPMLIFGFAAGCVVFSAALLLRRKVRLPRPVIYVLSCLFSAIIAWVMHICRALAISSAHGVTLLPSLRGVLVLLQIGVFTVFVIWLVELIVEKMKRKAEETSKKAEEIV